MWVGEWGDRACYLQVAVSGNLTAVMPIARRMSDDLLSLFVPCVLSEAQKFSTINRMQDSRESREFEKLIVTSCEVPHALSLLKCSISWFVE